MLKCSMQTERGEESGRKRQTERSGQKHTAGGKYKQTHSQQERQPVIEGNSEKERKRQKGIPAMTGAPHRSNET